MLRVAPVQRVSSQCHLSISDLIHHAQIPARINVELHRLHPFTLQEHLLEPYQVLLRCPVHGRRGEEKEHGVAACQVAGVVHSRLHVKRCIWALVLGHAYGCLSPRGTVTSFGARSSLCLNLV